METEFEDVVNSASSHWQERFAKPQTVTLDMLCNMMEVIQTVTPSFKGKLERLGINVSSSDLYDMIMGAPSIEEALIRSSSQMAANLVNEIQQMSKNFIFDYSHTSEKDHCGCLIKFDDKSDEAAHRDPTAEVDEVTQAVFSMICGRYEIREKSVVSGIQQDTFKMERDIHTTLGNRREFYLRKNQSLEEEFLREVDDLKLITPKIGHLSKQKEANFIA